MSFRVLAAATLVTALPCSTAASALDPDPNAASLNGEAALQAGFPSDPRVVEVRAGGVNRARTVGTQCTGFIADQPDYKITYQPRSGSLPLIFSVVSDSDTMLAIRAPDGAWYCDDDSGEGSNPAIRFNNPRGGGYSIFVGTYDSGGNARAQLRISELTSSVPSAAIFNGGGTVAASAGSAGTRPNPDTPSYNGSVTLATGFGGARQVRVRAGGDIDARIVSQQCTGFVGARPDYKVVYQAQATGGKVGSALPLIFTVRSDADTMLVINGPDGRWYCDDDGGDGNNPLVRFGAPASGRYDVFVGTYRAGDTVVADLSVAEQASGR
ncbi:hypothetical protein [Sphingomonas sp.]|uniref:hypothetical protein n=1 Tax=Sphingomonas sp. TaxID=28214 RepID=UPI003AFFC1BD